MNSNFPANKFFGKISLLILITSTLLTGCFQPVRNFTKYEQPPVPDYSKTGSWAALPGIKDSADAIPPGSGMIDGQAFAKVDVFYIHPTLDFSGKGWNGDIHNKKLNKRVDIYPIRFQASAFNGSCKVYAPRYRQATLYSFTKRAGVNGKKALDLAYEDVVRAFQYYLLNYNQGRPFVLAAHSQGSRHAYRLLHDFFDNNPVLQKQLVAAYIIGFKTDSVYKTIPACDSATQTGCILSWNTYKWGAKSTNEFIGSNVYCTNPLLWKCDTSYAGKELNLGGLPRRFDRVDKGITDAKIQNGLLWIHKPKKRGYFRVGRNYHVSDYNLFYSNIRKNVQERIDSYYRQKQE
ncbi:MAG: DUF3089 domain-containing protein [Bacteroidetes bacterium]|nr:DUF3089 domain-containing protein [Bacteroidota bacterium]